MVRAARARIRSSSRIHLGDLNTFEPREGVDATIGFRVLPFVDDLPAFMARVGAFTAKKVIFDTVPSTGRSACAVEQSLRLAEFDRTLQRPWLLPARTRVPGALRPPIFWLERVPYLADAITRARFSVVVTGWRSIDVRFQHQANRTIDDAAGSPRDGRDSVSTL
jgi:hypothetical protein